MPSKSLIIIKKREKAMTSKLIKNPHAGEILKEEFLVPLNLSQNALAKAIDTALLRWPASRPEGELGNGHRTACRQRLTTDSVCPP